jgi:nitrilase
VNLPQNTIRVAVIQAAPVFLDPQAGIEKARRLIMQAASKGVSLIAFSECWLPGFPIHAFSGMETAGWMDLAAEYLDHGIDIPGAETDALCEIARQFSVDIVMGVAERDPITRGSLYSTQLVINADGEIAGRHRKLRPAFNERSVFADGDGGGLLVFERDYGAISALASVEHQMVLPTYALAQQGTQFHVASWPGGEISGLATTARQHLLSRAFAAQAGAYVLCAGGILAPEDVPERYRHFLRQGLSGDSAIIDPRGEICAGPVTGETILYANCSIALIRTAKVAFDCAGHSGRNDQLEFRNHTLPEEDGEGQESSPGAPPQDDVPFGGDPTEFEAGGMGEPHKPGGPSNQRFAGGSTGQLA